MKKTDEQFLIIVKTIIYKRNLILSSRHDTLRKIKIYFVSNILLINQCSLPLARNIAEPGVFATYVLI